MKNKAIAFATIVALSCLIITTSPYYKHLWIWDPKYEFKEFTLTVPVAINP